MITELLKKSLPSYETTLPISGKKYKFRPMTVKEEKILLLAQKSESGPEMANALAQVIKNCFDGLESPEQMAIADVEKAFLELRAKSIGEEASFNIICPDTREAISIKTDLQKFELDKPKNRSNKIKLSDDMVLLLKEPDFSCLIEDDTEDSENGLKSMFKNCFVELQTSGNVFCKNEISDDDLFSFYDLMTKKQLDEFEKFVNSVPRMKKTIIYRTRDNEEKTLTIMGIESFFAYASATSV